MSSAEHEISEQASSAFIQSATEDYGVKARRLRLNPNVIDVDAFPYAVGSDGSTEKCDATPVPQLGSGFSQNTWVAAFELQYVLTNVIMKAASPNSTVLLTSVLAASSILNQQEVFFSQELRPGLQLEKKTILAVPVLIHDHYLTAVGFRNEEKGKWFILDSLQGYSDGFVSELAALLNSQSLTNWLEWEAEEKILFQYVESAKLQQNSFDCGIFCLMQAFKLVTQPELFQPGMLETIDWGEVEGRDASRYRSHIKSLLTFPKLIFEGRFRSPSTDAGIIESTVSLIGKLSFLSVRQLHSEVGLRKVREDVDIYIRNGGEITWGEFHFVVSFGSSARFLTSLDGAANLGVLSTNLTLAYNEDVDIDVLVAGTNQPVGDGLGRSYFSAIVLPAIHTVLSRGGRVVMIDESNNNQLAELLSTMYLNCWVSSPQVLLVNTGILERFLRAETEPLVVRSGGKTSNVNFENVFGDLFLNDSENEGRVTGGKRKATTPDGVAVPSGSAAVKKLNSATKVPSEVTKLPGGASAETIINPSKRGKKYLTEIRADLSSATAWDCKFTDVVVHTASCDLNLPEVKECVAVKVSSTPIIFLGNVESICNENSMVPIMRLDKGETLEYFAPAMRVGRGSILKIGAVWSEGVTVFEVIGIFVGGKVDKRGYGLDARNIYAISLTRTLTKRVVRHKYDYVFPRLLEKRTPISSFEEMLAHYGSIATVFINKEQGGQLFSIESQAPDAVQPVAVAVKPVAATEDQGNVLVSKQASLYANFLDISNRNLVAPLLSTVNTVNTKLDAFSATVAANKTLFDSQVSKLERQLRVMEDALKTATNALTALSDTVIEKKVEKERSGVPPSPARRGQGRRQPPAARVTRTRASEATQFVSLESPKRIMKSGGKRKGLQNLKNQFKNKRDEVRAAEPAHYPQGDIYLSGPPLLQQVGRSTGSEPQLAPRSAVLSSQHQAGFYQLEPQRTAEIQQQLAPRSDVVNSQQLAGVYQLEPQLARGQASGNILRGQHFAPRQQQGSYYRLESELQPPSRNQIVPFFQQPDGVLKQPSNQLAMKPSERQPMYYYS